MTVGVANTIIWGGTTVATIAWLWLISRHRGCSKTTRKTVDSLVYVSTELIPEHVQKRNRILFFTGIAAFIVLFVFGLTQNWQCVLRVVGITFFVAPWFMLFAAEGDSTQYTNVVTGETTFDLDWDADEKKHGCLGAFVKRSLPIAGLIIFAYCAYLAMLAITGQDQIPW